MTTVIKIIEAHLRTIGADGLVCTMTDCACVLDELVPCDGNINECQPGWRGALRDDDVDFTLYPSREMAESTKMEGGSV